MGCVAGNLFRPCCCPKLTWPIFIAWFHMIIYLAVIIFNCYNLTQAIISFVESRSSSSEEEREHIHTSNPHLTDLGLELMIAHSCCIIILSTCGFFISMNLLRGKKKEKEKSLKLWFVFTIVFCVLTVPYYVWRLSVSDENAGRWLIQLVATNAFEGYFLGIAYSLVTEMQADITQATSRDSNKFHALQSRDSQITFVENVMTTLKFSEMKI